MQIQIEFVCQSAFLPLFQMNFQKPLSYHCVVALDAIYVERSFQHFKRKLAKSSSSRAY